VLAGGVEALGPEGDVDLGVGAQVAVLLIGGEQGGEVVDDPGLGEAAAALELAVAVEGLVDLGGDAGRDAAGDPLVDPADLDERALVDLEVEGAGGLAAELLVAAASRR
jgi:hypothetical protein